MLKKGLCIKNVSFYPFQVEKESEPEEEADEDEGPVPVIVESESYVNLKKKISKRYDWQGNSIHAENAKICKQFRIKQVGYSKRLVSIVSPVNGWSRNSEVLLTPPVSFWIYFTLSGWFICMPQQT